MFRTQDCLIAAIKLTDLPGIATDTDCADVTYIHLLFDQHEVITANGAQCESLQTGPETTKLIPAAVTRRAIRYLSRTHDKSLASAP
jgi:hypothetical protein